MAVSNKGKRKIVRDDRVLYWYMKESEDWMHAYPGPQLHIISEDKNFAISYQPRQENENPFVIVKGNEFEGLDCSGNQWIRVKVPEWDDTQITPGFVRRLIDWCLDVNNERVRVDYLGRVEE